MSEGFTEPVAYIDQTDAGVSYGVTENAPEQVRTLIEGLQAPTRLSRDVTWGEQTPGVLDVVDVEVLWDEEDQQVTYSIPGVQDRSVALSDLAEELGRDWEHYLADSALAGELLGRLDAVLPEGIDAEEITTRFDPQAGAVTADVELVPVPTFDGLSTRGMRGQIGVSRYGVDLDLEGDVPARQLSEADARLVLSDAVTRANQEPVNVAFEEIRPYVQPFTDHGLEIDDPVVGPDGTVRVQVLTPAADAGGWLGGARAEQAITFTLDRDASGRDDGLVIRPGGSLTRELRDGTLAADDERIVEWLSPDLAVDPGVREMTDAQAAATILGMRPEAFEAAAQGIEAGLRSAERELAHPTRSTAVFHMLNEQAARLKREVLHGVPESELSTSLDLKRGMVWARPRAMDFSHRPITVGANPEGQTFEVVDRKEVPNGQVGPWADPQPLSDEQRAAGSRLVSEREATWDVDNAVLRDGGPSVATAWASMRLESSAGWWEPQEAAALERWARAQAALTGGDAQVTVYEASAPGSGDADGRLIDMQGQGLDCQVSTARTLSGENQVQVADTNGVQTLPVSELMDRVKGAWPDTATQALDQRAEATRQQDSTSLGVVSREADLREHARAAMRPDLDRIERMVGEGRIIVDGLALDEVVSSSGVPSIAPSVVLRPADAPTNDQRAVFITLRDPHFPSTETVITPREGAPLNPYIPERVRAAADLGIEPQLFDAVQATIGHGLAQAQYAATYPRVPENSGGAAQSTVEVAASQTRDEVPELTVYTKPDCPGCKMTKRELDKAGATYQEVDLTTRPDLVEEFTAEGLRSAPVVELGEQRIAGFDPAKIRAIAAQAMSPTPPTTAAAPTEGSSPSRRPAPPQEQAQVRGEAR